MSKRTLAKIRGILTLVMATVGVVVSFTGIAMLLRHHGPRGTFNPGSIPPSITPGAPRGMNREVESTFLGFDGRSLGDIHTDLAILMLVLVFIHFLLNWKMLKSELGAIWGRGGKIIND